MRLVNILALTHAKLINEPFVSDFENIVFDAKKIRRGDLFVAFNNSDIEEAIFNGAYGIVFDKPTQITDSEIAWIKVENIPDALTKILRFRLIERKVISYSCDEISIELSKQIITQTNFITLYSNIKDIFLSLWNIEENSIILFTPSLTNQDLFTDIKKPPALPDKINLIKIKDKTLFETAFIHNNIFYERQPLSPFFIPYLEKLLYLYKTLDISYRLKKFTQLKHFEAVFVTKDLIIKDFGTTDQVIIFESDENLIDKEAKFLQDNASWAKIIYITKKQTNNEIINKLINNDFNFALILSDDKSILKEEVKNKETSLF